VTTEALGVESKALATSGGAALEMTLGAMPQALLSQPATSVFREVSGGHPLSEFGRLRPLLERRG